MKDTMVKIEVEVRDTEDNKCNVTIKKPKPSKSGATETEQMTANVVKNTIDDAIKNLSNK